ncbi:MAG: lytic transglycosylase domain-containing protein [Gammaproteobacteria bacterium]|nr:lytic transglycosylase domain-containing protein [Gammaproteobacteria bacterium]
MLKLLGGLLLAFNLNIVTADATTNDQSELRLLLQQAIESSDSFKDRFDAEVWLLDMSSRLKKLLPEKKERINLLKVVHQEAKRSDLHPELVLAVIHIESRFDRFAISRAGAQGLMQVMPFWLKEIGHPEDNLVDLKTNLRMGCTILKYYLDKEKGDLVRALARYNGSTGRRVYSDKVLDILRTHWFKR